MQNKQKEIAELMLLINQLEIANTMRVIGKLQENNERLIRREQTTVIINEAKVAATFLICDTVDVLYPRIEQHAR